MNNEKYELFKSVDEDLLRVKGLLDDYFKEKELEKVKKLKKMVRKEFELAWKRSVALDSGEVIKIIDEVFGK